MSRFNQYMAQERAKPKPEAKKVTKEKPSIAQQVQNSKKIYTGRGKI